MQNDETKHDWPDVSGGHLTSAVSPLVLLGILLIKLFAKTFRLKKAMLPHFLSSNSDSVVLLHLGYFKLGVDDLLVGI